MFLVFFFHVGFCSRRSCRCYWRRCVEINELNNLLIIRLVGVIFSKRRWKWQGGRSIVFIVIASHLHGPIGSILTLRFMWYEFVGSIPCFVLLSMGALVFLPPQKPMGGFMKSFYDVKIWRLAVKPSTCFAQKHTFNIDIKPSRLPNCGLNCVHFW
jgi:hypothetical protein